MASSSSQTGGSTAEKSKRNREIPSHDISESDRASKCLKTDGSLALSAAEKAKRNRKICFEKISKYKGADCVKLEEMLVEQSWLEALPGEFQKPYAINLCKYVENQICTARNDLLRSFYPPQHLIFDAFNTTPFRSVKAVILCQGLSISVPEGVAVPTTVENIIHEVKQDLGYSNPSHGDPGYGNLEKWALQGVLFLNAVLTGNGNLANKNAHTKEGWENFTDAVVERISQRKDNIVFLVWGHYAKEKIRLIDGNKHHILKASHPTKYTFFNCKHFSETNKYLVKRGIDPIDWQL